MPQSNVEVFGLDQAILNLADQLSASDIPIEDYKLSSFDNFVQEIFSLSYPNYFFNSWHIRKTSSFLDDVLASDSKMGEVVLPRYHLKSTLCLAPETLVRIGRKNKFKQIQDIKEGDYVFTHLGRKRKVLKVSKRNFIGKIIVLELGNKEIIKVTSEHPVLTKEGWKEASKLKRTDILMMYKNCANRILRPKGLTDIEYYGEEKAKLKSEKISRKIHKLFVENHPFKNKTYEDIYGERADEMRFKIGRKKKKRGCCLQCGKQLKNLGTSFCSYSCRSKYRMDNGLNPNFNNHPFGEKNFHWIDGRSFLPYSKEFNSKLKKEIKSRDGFCCQLCDSKEVLQVHHIDYDKYNLDKTNLITLCNRCNFKVNHNREYWKDYFSAKIAVKYNILHNGMNIVKISKEEYTGDVYNLSVDEDNTFVGKGIVFHNCGVSFSIYRMLTSFGDGLYVSYKDDLVNLHMSNIKAAIRNNPILSKFMVDLNPRSESTIYYKIGNRRVRIFGSGIFAMKRGLHTDLNVSVDDILGTVENPMMLGDLEKAERMFNQEVVNIPNKGCPMIVYGTTIHHTDLLFQLKDNPQFMVLWMPAINPDGIHDVLWEDKFDRKTLEAKKTQGGWRAFSSEFLLMPVMATQAFFSREELDKVIDKNLVNHHVPGW